MSTWKVEKLFEVEDFDISGIAVDNNDNVYFTFFYLLCRWNNGECHNVFSELALKTLLSSPTWDHTNETLCSCTNKGILKYYPNYKCELSPVTTRGIKQIVAVDGHFAMLDGDGTFYFKTRTIRGKYTCLINGIHHIGAVSRTHMLLFNQEDNNYKEVKILRNNNEKFLGAVEVDDRGFMLVSLGKLWLLKDGKISMWHSNLEGVKFITRDQKGNIYAASSRVVWKITKQQMLTDKPRHWKRLKLFLVGDGGAGKTSTLRWLMGQPFSDLPSRTDGAEVTTTELRSWKKTSVDIKEHMALLILQQKSETLGNFHKFKLQNINFSECVVDVNIRYKLHFDPPYHLKPSATLPSHKLDNSQEDMKPNEPQIASPPAVTDELLNDVAAYEEKLLRDQLPMSFHIWDFGGQEVYYNTHHFFLTEVAIYLLVMDLTQSTSSLLSRLQFWLNSIRSYSPEAPIVIIGTHREKVSQQETKSKIATLWKEAQQIQNPPTNQHIIAISCKSDGDLRTQTQRLLVKMAETETAKKSISFCYMLFFHTLEQAAAKVQSSLTHLRLAEAREQAINCGMTDEDMLKALQCFHQLGFLMYYADNCLLNDIIFMQPTQLVDILRAVVTITHTESLAENNNIQFGPSAALAVPNQVMDDEEAEAIKTDGRLTNGKLSQVWRSYKFFIPQLRSLLKQFGLAVPDPNQADKPEEQRDLIVPCLVQIGMESIPVLQKMFTNPQTMKLKLKGASQPLGLVSRIIVKALQMAQKTEEAIPACLLFKGGCAFCYYGTYIRLVITTDAIKIQVQYPTSNQMLLEIEVAKKVLKELQEFLTDLPYTEHVTCFKCKATPCTMPTQTFMCHPCQVISLSAKKNRPTGPGIALFKQDQWKSLGLLLDNNGDWRMLGEKLGLTLLELEDIERRAKESSPTKILLTEWLNGVDAYVMDTLITALKDINNHDAVTLLQQNVLPQN